MQQTAIDNLNELAKEVGVLTAYHSWKGELTHAKPDILLQVLQMLGLDIHRAEDAPAALQAYRRELWNRLVSPCAVAWDGEHALVGLRVTAADNTPYRVELELESGDKRIYEGRLYDLHPPKEIAEIDGKTMALRQIRLPIGDLGYHRAVVRVGNRAGHCTIISAPTKAYQAGDQKHWGVFAPLYATWRENGSGMGDLGDLLRLSQWTAEHGGSFIGTLPLLAAFLTDNPYEYSPYSPVSRLFWNELYLNLETAPGIELSQEAKQVLASAEFRKQAESLRAEELVDYRGQMAHRRAVLAILAEAAWKSDALRGEIDAFMQRKPRANDYASFRAATEAFGKVWLEWPEAQREGKLAESDYDDRIRRYHLYVQYAMDTQLSRLGQQGNATLYLDLPVGVNRGGYDTWRDRSVFVLNAAAGAPPDGLFAGGQNWGLPPLQPRKLRETGYRYFIDCVRTHVEHAGLLRIDHAMGLHRLYWIPDGVSAKDGIYIHYNAGEMYAVVTLESHRHRCAVAGEDLGVVPEYVPPAMRHHGLSSLYVGQFSVPGEVGEEIKPPPPTVVASLNTHDTPTLRGFWQGKEIDDQLTLQLITPEENKKAHTGRQETCQAIAAHLHELGFLDTPDGSEDSLDNIMRALTTYLGQSDARMVLLTLEDLWLEARPHNIPGTGPGDRPNWRRKMSRSLDSIISDDKISGILRSLQEARASAKK